MSLNSPVKLLIKQAFSIKIGEHMIISDLDYLESMPRTLDVFGGEGFFSRTTTTTTTNGKTVSSSSEEGERLTPQEARALATALAPLSRLLVGLGQPPLLGLIS